MSVSFCLPHPVAVSAFMICRGLCACTEMLWMCVLYVSFGSKVRPRTFGRVAMGSALLFIVRSRLLVYSAGSGVNRVQVVSTVLQSSIPKISSTYTGSPIVSSVVMCVDISSPMPLIFSIATLHTFGPNMVPCFTISCTVILSVIHTGVYITMCDSLFISYNM